MQEHNAYPQPNGIDPIPGLPPSYYDADCCPPVFRRLYPGPRELMLDEHMDAIRSCIGQVRLLWSSHNQQLAFEESEQGGPDQGLARPLSPFTISGCYSALLRNLEFLELHTQTRIAAALPAA